MTMMTDARGLRPQLIELGKEAHRLLHRACLDKGMALQKQDDEDGRVIVTTLASFIYAASSSLGGDPIDERDVHLIRKYMLSTGNVKVLGEIGSTRKFRIWVREQWTDTSIPPSTNGNGAANGRARAEARLTPAEAGEDREPAPVKIRTASGKRVPMSLDAKTFLAYLADVEVVEDEGGYCTRKIHDATGLTMVFLYSAVKRFVRNRWVTVDHRSNPKRTFRIAITEAGRQEAVDRGLPIVAQVQPQPEPQPEIEAPFEQVPEPEPTFEPTWVHAEIEKLIQNEVSQRVRRITAHLSDDWKVRIKAILDSDLTPLNMLVKIEEEVS